jgi:hypothetical protein
MLHRGQMGIEKTAQKELQQQRMGPANEDCDTCAGASASWKEWNRPTEWSKFWQPVTCSSPTGWVNRPTQID